MEGGVNSDRTSESESDIFDVKEQLSNRQRDPAPAA